MRSAPASSTPPKLHRWLPFFLDDHTSRQVLRVAAYMLDVHVLGPLVHGKDDDVGAAVGSILFVTCAVAVGCGFSVGVVRGVTSCPTCVSGVASSDPPAITLPLIVKTKQDNNSVRTMTIRVMRGSALNRATISSFGDSIQDSAD